MDTFGGTSQTIAGGGSTAMNCGDELNLSCAQSVVADYGSIGGGGGNYVSGTFGTIGGGDANDVTAKATTVAGGQVNRASAQYASVGGGLGNVASGSHAVVAGGEPGYTETAKMGSEAALCLAFDAEAGAVTLEWFRSGDLDLEHKGDGTPVTAADKASEARLRELIGAFAPEDTILGEEEGHSPGSGERRWIIDPIDGTKAFSAGAPPG